MSKFLAASLTIIALAAGAAAQTAPARPGPATSPSPDLSPVLAQIQQVTDSMRLDLARLRIEKWKTDSSYKKQAQANAESLDRNIAQALPALMSQARSSPDSVAAVFKLYRNVSALYEVAAGLTETAGAFGSKEEYQSLATNAANLDSVRRRLADLLETLAASKDAQVARMQNQARQAPAASSSAVKKVVVDDNEPAKKPARKKKPQTPAAKPEQTGDKQ